jgi:alpha-glucosidase
MAGYRLERKHVRRVTALLALVCLLACGVLAPALADVTDVAAPAATIVATAKSPDGQLQVDISIDGEGRAAYQIIRKGELVIAPSRLGFVLTNGPKLDGRFAPGATSSDAHDDTWEQPWGERRFVRDHYNEVRVDLVQAAYNNRRMTVVFRVFDDGVGFRYEFPDQAQLHEVKISEELTEFAVVDKATALWALGGEMSNLEYLYKQTPLDEVSQAQTPLTVRTQAGTYIAFHEAALVDYPAIWIRRIDGQRLRTQLAPSAIGPAAVRPAPFTTPWRMMIITDSVPTLLTSDIELNLNAPNVLGDVSWVRPYKYVGIWWEMHLDKSTWSSGPRHGATTQNTRKYMDFAAQNGFRGVLVEGWNKGWDGTWYGNGSDFSYTEAYADFDIRALSAYGLKKGVHLIGHHETGGNIAHYEDQMVNAFKLDESLGIDSVKTGYVHEFGAAQMRAPDGSIFYGNTDSQQAVEHYVKNVVTAAKYHLAIDTHEPVKDTGLRRTYPNWVSREGARGQEYNAWGNPINPPEHDVNLVFTRMLSGPMDYTPGILSLEGNKKDLLSTQARQLALYVVLYSPIQMAADLPKNYARYPKAFQFIKDVAVDWEQSLVLNGEMGDYVTFARKDRHSENWFIGAITDEEARTLAAPLAFLTPGTTYTAEIYRDGPNAGLTGDARFDIVIEKRAVTSADTLELKLAPGGGEAIRFVPRGKLRK